MELGNVWVFDETKLAEALSAYSQEALDAYPQREELIETVVVAMQDFLKSEHAARLRMD